MEGDRLQTAALHIKQLSVAYGETPVLWDVNLEVPKGKLVAILGPNGAGKSTLLKAILGLTPVISGQVQLFGETLKKQLKQIAYVPQRESVDWDFPITVEELVLMGRYGYLGLLRWPSKADRELADHYLDQVEMKRFKERQISQLSQGQQQRVFIARALMQEAQIYLMDEPLSGIDLATEKTIMRLLKELQSQGKTIFVVHHDLHTVKTYFDWAIVLNMRLIAQGAVKEVFNEEVLKLAYGKNYALFDQSLKHALDQN